MVNDWNSAYVITVGDNVYTNSYPKSVGKYYHRFMYPHEPTYGGSDTTTINHFCPIVWNHDWDVIKLKVFNEYCKLLIYERYFTFKLGDIEFFTIHSDCRWHFCNFETVQLDTPTNYKFDSNVENCTFSSPSSFFRWQ